MTQLELLPGAPSALLPEPLETRRLAAIAALGRRWLLHPANSPRKGQYAFPADIHNIARPVPALGDFE